MILLCDSLYRSIFKIFFCLFTNETVEAKYAFERFAELNKVTIKHYCADNGRFANNGFIQACKLQNQRLTYCGVNAHFQNGIAEKQIRDLQEQARIMLLHAINQWPNMLSIHLWPYAFRHANEVSTLYLIIKMVLPLWKDSIMLL